MEAIILQENKKVTAHRQLYNVKRTIGTKNVEVEMFGTANA